MKPLTIALLLLIALAIWLATRGEVRSLPRGEPTNESSAGPQKANLSSENPTESGRTPPPVDMDQAPDLRGSVRSESNLPLADVRVALVHGSWRDRDPDNDDGTLLAETWTDTEGSFAFQGIEPNEHAPQRPLFMIAEARGYLEARQAVALGRDTRFTLIPRAASVIVRGRVLGEGGRFLPRFEHSDLARVEDERGVRVESSWKAHQQQEPGFQLVLNHGGSASFVFTVRAPGYSSLSKELTPSGGHVEAGDIILPLSRSVFGWVVDADDETPVGNATIEPFLTGSRGAIGARSAATDGRFELALPAGDDLLGLLVRAQGHAPRWLNAEDVGGNWHGVVVRLHAGAAIEGQVVTSEGAGVGGARVAAWIDDPLVVSLAGAWQGSSAWSREVRADTEGHYRFQAVPRGLVAVGVLRGGVDAPPTSSRVHKLRIEDDSLHLCDFTLGGGVELRGSIELYGGGESDLYLEILDPSQDPPAMVAAGPTTGTRFEFDDLQIAPGTPLVLRLSLAPGFYAERRVVVDGPKADVGTLRFATSEDMKEFNRPGREIVMTLPTGR